MTECYKKLINSPFALRPSFLLLLLTCAMSVYSVMQSSITMAVIFLTLGLLIALVSSETKLLANISSSLYLHFFFCWCISVSPCLVYLIFSLQVEVAQLSAFTSGIALLYWWFYLDAGFDKIKLKYKE